MKIITSSLQIVSNSFTKFFFQLSIAMLFLFGTFDSFGQTINYAGSPFCYSNASASVTQTGDTWGIYSSTSGLAINSTTGEINIGSSTPGTYSVSYALLVSNAVAVSVTPTTTNYMCLSSLQSLAQTFIPTADADLSAIDINVLAVNTAGTAVLNIYEGAAISANLKATLTVAISASGVISFPLSTPVAMVSSQSYTFEFVAIGSLSANLAIDTTNSYASGSAFAQGVEDLLDDLYFVVRSGAITTATASVQINPTPTIADKTTDVCSGLAFTVSPVNGTDIVPSGTTYSWSVPGAVSGITGLAAGTSESTISGTLTNTTNAPLSVVYSVTAISADACTGTPFNVTVAVNPKPIIAAKTTSICSGTSFSVSPTNGTDIVPDDTTYSWTAPAAITGISGLAAGTNASDISGTLTNTTNAPINVVYSVTPSANVAPISSPTTINIVDRLITYSGVSINGLGNSAFVTAGSNVSLAYSISVAFSGTGYCPGCVVQNYIGIGGTNQIIDCQAAIYDGLSNSVSASFVAPTTPGVYYLTQTYSLQYNCVPVNFDNAPANAIGVFVVGTSAYTCSGTPFDVTVTVNPTPTIADKTAVACSGTAFSVTPSNGTDIVPAETYYSWAAPTTSGINGLALGSGATSVLGTLTNTTNAPIDVVYSVTPYTGINLGLNYTIYSTHAGNGDTTQYISNPTNASGFTDLLNTAAHSNTTVTSSGIASPSVLFNFSDSAGLTSNGIAVPNNGDYFAVEVSGTFIAAETGVYTFGVDGDDAVDLSINGTVICSQYGNHGFNGITLGTGTISLVAGTHYTIKARMQEFGGGEGLLVQWKRPSQSVFALQADEIGERLCTGAPFNVTVTVKPKPTVEAISNQSICSDHLTTDVVFTSNLGVSGTTFDWINDTPSIDLDASGSGDILAFTALNSNNTPVTATIIVTPNADSCSGTPIYYTYSISPTPTVDAVSDQTLCQGDSTTAVAFSSALNVAGTIFNWTNDTPGIGLAATGTGDIASFAPINTTNAPIVSTITVTPDIAGSQSIINDVNTGNFSEGNDNIMQTFIPQTSGTISSIELLVQPGMYGGGMSYIVMDFGMTGDFQMLDNLPPFPTWITFNFPPQTVLAGNSYNFNIWSSTLCGGDITVGTNNNYADGSIANYYSCSSPGPITDNDLNFRLNIDGGVSCTGIPETFTITVNPKPAIANAAQTICSEDTFTVTPTNGTDIVPVGTTYSWSAPSAITGISGLAAGTSASAISGTLTNATDLPIDVTYVVIPTSADSCIGAAFNVTITVNPLPAIPAQTATICSGTAFTISPVNNVVGSGSGSGNAADFDGIDDGIITTYPANIDENNNTTVTWEAWVYPTVNDGNYRQVMGVEDGYWDRFVAIIGGYINVSGWNAVTADFNTWQHIAVVFDNSTSTTKLYKNGVLYSNPGGLGTSNSSRNFGIGCSQQSGLNEPTQTFQGKIDEVRYWMGERTQAEIQAAMNNELEGNEPNLAAYYNFNQGTASGTNTSLTTLTDSTSNAYNGTLYNFALTGSTSNWVPGSTLTPVAPIVPANTTYTWTVVDNPNITGDVDEAIAQSSISQNLINISNTAQDVVYTVSPGSGAGCTGASFDVTVTVKPVPAIADVAESICSTDTFTVIPSNGTDIVPAGTTYSWSAPGAVSGITGLAAGTNASSISGTLINTTNAPLDVVYTVTPSEAGPPPPSIGSTYEGGIVTYILQPSDSGYINGQTTMLITSPVDQSVSATMYNVPWQVFNYTSGSGIGDGLANTNSIISEINSLGANPSLFAAGIARDYNGGGFNDWYLPSNDELVIMYQNIGQLAAAPNTNIANFTWNPYWSSTRYDEYTSRQPSYSLLNDWAPNWYPFFVRAVRLASFTPAISCTGTPFNITVTVNPKPAIADVAETICSGTAFSVAPINGTDIVPVGTTYSWSVPAAITGITGVAAGTNASDISGTLTNTSSAPVDVIYVVTPSTTDCTGNTFNVTVTVNPESVGVVSTKTVCSQELFSYNPQDNIDDVNGNSLPSDFAWEVTDVQGTISGAQINDLGTGNVSGQITNTSNAPATVEYTVTPTSAPYQLNYTLYATHGGNGDTTNYNVLAYNSSDFDAMFDVTNPTTTKLQTGTANASLLFNFPNVGALQNAGILAPNDFFGFEATGTFVPTQTGMYAFYASADDSVELSIGGTLVCFATNSSSNGGISLVAGTSYPIRIRYQEFVAPEGLYIAWQRPGDSTFAFHPEEIAYTGGGCVGDPFTVTVTVNPEPVGVVSSATVCSQEAFSYDPQVNVNDTNGNSLSSTFAWEVTNIQGTVSGVGLSQTGSGNVSGQITNTYYLAAIVEYTVTPTSVPDGCEGTPFTVTVTVNPEPVGNLVTQSVCSDQSFSLDSKDYIINSVSSSFAWAVTDLSSNVNNVTLGDTGTGIITGNANNISNSTGFIEYTVTPTSMLGGCLGSDFTVMVNVNPEPVVTDQNFTVCTNAPTNMNFSLGSGVTPDYYVVTNLNLNGLTISSGNPLNDHYSVDLANDAFINNTNATVDVVYDVTPYFSVDNCDGNPFQVIVHVLPTLSTSITNNGSNTICGNESASLTVTTVGAQMGLWTTSGTGVISPNVTNSTISYLPSEADIALGNVTLTFTASNVCQSVTDSETITINPAPAVDAGADVTICSGENIILSATANPNLSYVWSPSIGLNTTTGTTVTANPSSTTTYTVTGTTSDGCVTTDEVTVNVNNLPLATFTASNSSVCEGAAVTLTANSGSGYTYSWSDGTNEVGITQSIAINLTASRNFTVTVTNASGCSETSSAATITVYPIPVVTISASATLVCPGTSATLTASSAASYLWSSGETTQAITVSPTSASSYSVRIIDANGCSATSLVTTVTVSDTTIPTITAPLAVTTTTNNGCFALNVSLGTPATSDNCSVASVMNNAPTTFPIGATTVTWTVTDASGNTATATQLVTITDASNPTIVAPAALTVSSSATCGVTGLALGTPVTSDNCSVTLVANDSPVTFPLGATTVTWTVTDASGNTATATQLVTVVDTTAPNLTTPVAMTATAGLGCTATVSLTAPVATDNCTTVTLINNAPATYPIGVTTVTWTATDGSGNVTIKTQTVTVTDTTIPTITAPSNITLNVSGSCSVTGINLGLPTIDDNCIASLIVTNDAPAGNTFAVGVNTIIWTVVDGSGNTATATQTVTVIDNIAPVLNTVAPIVTTAGNACTAAVTLIAPIATDNCTNSLVVTNNAPVSGIYPLGITTITWSVTDASGNTTTTAQTVTVLDVTSPVFVPIAPINANAGNNCIATVALPTPVAFDNCTSVVAITNNAPATYPIGTTTVVWTATDESGNTATANQLVIVTDATAPTVLTQNVTIALDENGQASITAALINNASTDNCGILSITASQLNFDCGNAGANTVTLTITDIHGNVATGTAIVTVENTFGDNDTDGIKDNCDDDDDNDNILDVDDNCPLNSNIGQEDNDNDGLGNVCDDDDDNDGVLDFEDNCPMTYNPNQEDRDNDGIGDVCDTIEINISQAVTPNGDGINDTWMIYNIEQHPKSVIHVFNRWGSEVFYAKNYQNNWNGFYKDQTQPLPDGSYYYQIDLNGDGKVDNDGWIYITRL